MLTVVVSGAGVALVAFGADLNPLPRPSGGVPGLRAGDRCKYSCPLPNAGSKRWAMAGDGL